jgi:alpha-beta hydrolase superfamily lysophospholipase
MTDGSEATTVLHAIETSGQWIGPVDRPLMSWLSAPVGGSGAVGAVIVPPVGYEYWSSHRTLRTLAERLAQQGCRALRFDFDGTGDSAGDQWDRDRMDAWRSGVDHAADALRRWGVSTLVVIGLRIGGTLALLQGGDVGADAVVAWAPVVKGRRYVRELQLLGLAVPEAPESPERSGGVVQAGSVFSAETLADLGAIDLATLPSRPASRVLVVDRDDKPPSASLLERLRALGVEPDHLVRPGTDLSLDRPTEYATVAGDIVDDVCRWVGPGDVEEPPPAAATPDHRTTATIGWHGGSVDEEVTELGEGSLVGILTRPPGTSRGTVVWLNSGSEAHVGPGRAWVEYARELALSGFTSLRLDFSGWGESPDRGHAPGRPYDPHGVDEVAEAVGALRKRGHERIVLAGLCAGAWIALRAALMVDVDGVVAINPQLYWQPGDPVEADIVAETRVRRLPEIRRNKRLRGIGAWWLLDVIGVRHPAAVWVRGLAQRNVPAIFVFAEGDDGLEFLHDRIGRAWNSALGGGRIESGTVAGIDHPMHRHWYRMTMAETIRRWLDVTLPADRVTGSSDL